MDKPGCFYEPLLAVRKETKHGITESQNNLGQKRPLQPSCLIYAQNWADLDQM